MRKGFGICCILLGICCLIASVGFIVYNHWEEEKAQSASESILQDVRISIQENAHEESTPEESVPDDPTETSEDVPQEMHTTPVGSYECIGVLTIPVLELELPILSNWNYAKLKVAPCQYFGSCFENNFVIAAHNYQSHFGRLSLLQTGDLVLFTDITGTVFCYEVVLLETLPGNATEEMITSGFDLSLYTCTPGGASRVTVRCNAISG